MKNKKGFTLVELMIVIAIIGILAVVLIPRIGSMKDEVKLKGIDTNINVAVGIINAKIQDYNNDEAGRDQLETDAIARLGDVKNPFTEATGGKPDSGAGAISAGNAAFIFAATDTNHDALDAVAAANRVGAIGIVAYDNSGLCVDLIPYDETGAEMTAKIKTIKK